MDHLIRQAEKLPKSKNSDLIVGYIKDAANTRNPRVAAVALGSALLLAQQTYANTPTPVDLGINGEELKGLILGLIATIALIGTAYITVLVGISAFSLIRRVVRG